MFLKIKTMTLKKEKLTPLRVFRDEAYELKTSQDLETARQNLQVVLDMWNGLDLIPCTDIVQLILNPQTVYGNAVNQLAEPPATKGRFQISKQAYISTLDVPIPDNLYRSAREARRYSFAAMPDLWSVSGNQIVMNETEKEALINSQSVYISNPDKIKLVKKLQSWVDLTNQLNETLLGDFLRPNPVTTEFCRGRFII